MVWNNSRYRKQRLAWRILTSVLPPGRYLVWCLGGSIYKGPPTAIQLAQWICWLSISIKLILRTENCEAGITSNSLRFISFSAHGPSTQHYLFGVTNDGKFYKRYPSQDQKDSWLGTVLKIGTSGWDNF